MHSVTNRMVTLPLIIAMAFLKNIHALAQTSPQFRLLRSFINIGLKQ